jgi:hypothetical protein
VDIVIRLRNEARNEPSEPIWREAIAEIEKLRLQVKQFEEQKATKQRVLDKRNEILSADKGVKA